MFNIIGWILVFLIIGVIIFWDRYDFTNFRKYLKLRYMSHKGRTCKNCAYCTYFNTDWDDVENYYCLICRYRYLTDEINLDKFPKRDFTLCSYIVGTDECKWKAKE